MVKICNFYKIMLIAIFCIECVMGAGNNNNLIIKNNNKFLYIITNKYISIILNSCFFILD